MKLYGRQWTRQELTARVGRLEQIGGVRRMRLAEGPEEGTELIQVRTGAGLAYTISPTKGLDLSAVEFGGVPLAWQSPNGDVHSAYHTGQGLNWLRTASGGMLMTCGLTHVGPPEEAPISRGLHGVIHHTPARQVAAEGRWTGDEYDIRVRGVLEEVSIFGDKLRLTREISSRLGENVIRIRDEVENIGFQPSPLMILYHINLGFPLMSEETTIRFPSRAVAGREPDLPLEGYDAWQAPDPDFRERVYFHKRLETDERGYASVIVRNPRFPLAGAGAAPTAAAALRIRWKTDTLPQLVQWRMPGAGEHVLGIEPANCRVEGISAARERGTLQTLRPGEARTFQLELEMSVHPANG